MGKVHRNRGAALPFTILAMIVVSGFVISMSNMNQGLKNQIFHTNNHQLSFLMAYSAFSRVLAKVHSFAWPNRPFASAPYVESKVPLQGGTYDLFVENTPGKSFQADMYIRTHLAGISRMYYWRIKFNDDLLDVANRVTVEFFMNAEAGDFPKTSGPTPFSQKVDGLLARRAANQRNSDLLAMQAGGLRSPKSILQKMNGRPLAAFDEVFPSDPEDLIMAGKPPATFPLIGPPSSGELPTGEGPGPGVVASGFPPMSPTYSPLDDGTAKLQSLVGSASLAVLTNTDKGWKEIEDKGVDGLASSAEYAKAAKEAKDQAYSAMSNILSQTAGKLADAPSAEAKAAIEEMISQTVVSGMANIVKAIDRSYDQFDIHGDSYLMSLPTSAAVQDLAKAWDAATDRTLKDVETLNALAAQMEGYSMDPKVAETMKASLENAQKQYELVKSYADLAHKRAEELKALEEKAAADALASETAAANEPPVPAADP